MHAAVDSAILTAAITTALAPLTAGLSAAAVPHISGSIIGEGIGSEVKAFTDNLE
jgi:hypothetical protein